jgi:hypothetical protein
MSSNIVFVNLRVDEWVDHLTTAMYAASIHRSQSRYGLQTRMKDFTCSIFLLLFIQINLRESF